MMITGDAAAHTQTQTDYTHSAFLQFSPSPTRAIDSSV